MSGAPSSTTSSLQREWDIEYYFRIFNAASARTFSRGFLLSMIPFHTTSHDFLSSTDGLILVDPVDNDPLLEIALKRSLPCITIGRNTRSANWVDNDFVAGTTAALDHIAPASPALFLSDTTSSYVRDELTAYLEWCTKSGVTPSVIHSQGPTVAEAEQVIFDALKNPNRTFDAVVSTLDTLAIATERSAHRLGLSVPEELQILSLSDSRYFDFGSGVSMTALDLHPVQLGELAVDLLINQISGDTEQKRELVDTSLQVRNSTRRP